MENIQKKFREIDFYFLAWTFTTKFTFVLVRRAFKFNKSVNRVNQVKSSRASIERHLFLTAFFGCVQPQTGRVQRHTQAPHSVFP